MPLNVPSLVSLIDATTTSTNITSGLGPVIDARQKPVALISAQDPSMTWKVWQEVSDTIFEKLFPILLTSLSKTAQYYLSGEVKKLSAITTTSIPTLVPPFAYPELIGALTVINSSGLYNALNESGTRSNASNGIGKEISARVKVEALPAAQDPSLAWKVWQAICEILTARMLTALSAVAINGMVTYISTAVPTGNTVPASAAGTVGGIAWAGTNPFSTTFTGTLANFMMFVMNSSIYSSVTNGIGKIIMPVVKAAALSASQDPSMTWKTWQAFVDKYIPIFINNYVNYFSREAIEAILDSQPTLGFTPAVVPGILATVPTPTATPITFSVPAGYIAKMV